MQNHAKEYELKMLPSATFRIKSYELPSLFLFFMHCAYAPRVTFTPERRQTFTFYEFIQHFEKQKKIYGCYLKSILFNNVQLQRSVTGFPKRPRRCYYCAYCYPFYSRDFQKHFTHGSRCFQLIYNIYAIKIYFIFYF